MVSQYLLENEYMDYSNVIISNLASQLFDATMTDMQKIVTAFSYLRRNIPHSFRVDSNYVTAKASDVLRYKTGIYHASLIFCVRCCACKG